MHTAALTDVEALATIRARLSREWLGAYSSDLCVTNTAVWQSRWEFFTLKSGKPGKRMREVFESVAWRCVARCAICGVFRRTGVTGVDSMRIGEELASTLGLDIVADLCLGCRNSLRPFVRQFGDANALRLSINRIKRKLRESTKDVARTD